MKKLFLILSVCLLGMSVFGQMSIPTPIVESEPLTPIRARGLAATYSFNNWGVTKLGLDSIILSGNRGKGVKIGIVDTGEPNHPDYVDNIKGVFNGTEDEFAADKHGHATHVGGIIHEIAPEADLYFAKGISDAGGGRNAWVSSCILWCVDQEVDLINLSLGGGHSADLEQAIKYAYKKGIIITAAVGNDGYEEGKDKIIYPAKYKETLGVGAMNDKHEPSTFSNSGPDGHIMAAGEKILSTYLNGKYIVLSGTSMATPYVSGVGALYLAAGGEPKEFIARVNTTAEDMSTAGFDWITFNGELKPLLALSGLHNDDRQVDSDKPPTSSNDANWPALLLFGVVVVMGGLLLKKSKSSAA